MSESMTQLTDDSFAADVLQSPVPVLVDFWAPWCGPCKMIAPVLDELAGEYAGRLRIAKYNVDDHTKYAIEHGIRGIPALLIFKGGAVVDRIIGALPKSVIKEKIDHSL